MRQLLSPSETAAVSTGDSSCVLVTQLLSPSETATVSLWLQLLSPGDTTLVSLRHSCCLMHWLQLRYDFDLIVTSVDAPSDIQCHSTVNGVAKSNQSHNIAATTVWMLFLLFSVSEWCFSCFVLLNWFAAVVLSDDIITHWCWCLSLFFVRQHTQHTERDIV